MRVRGMVRVDVLRMFDRGRDGGLGGRLIRELGRHVHLRRYRRRRVFGRVRGHGGHGVDGLDAERQLLLIAEIERWLVGLNAKKSGRYPVLHSVVSEGLGEVADRTGANRHWL